MSKIKIAYWLVLLLISWGVSVLIQAQQHQLTGEGALISLIVSSGLIFVMFCSWEFVSKR